MSPTRIQRRRAKGWRLPEGAIIVDRSTPWGNPFIIGVDGNAAYCVFLHQQLLAGLIAINAKASIEDQDIHRHYVAEHIDELRGHDLACWCRAGKPCHGDTLLKLANAKQEAA